MEINSQYTFDQTIAASSLTPVAPGLFWLIRVTIVLLQSLFLYSLLSLCCSLPVFADTIYQWTDPWGQVQYSKTPVSGAMISELTELPKKQGSSEQQKQQAMLKKMQEMHRSQALYKQKKSTEKYIRQQNKKNENHCRSLRNLLTDVLLRNTRKYYYRDNYYFPGAPYYPGDLYYSGGSYYPGRYDYTLDYPYDFLKNDLSREIREYCR